MSTATDEGDAPPAPIASLLVVNGAAVPRPLRTRIVSLAPRLLPGCRIEISQEAGDVERQVAEAARAGARRVVVAGGDGTVHEAVNGLQGTDTELAIVPCGSGNDFARGLGLPSEAEAALTCAATEHARTLDCGTVTCPDFLGQTRTRAFANIAEAGLGGEVVRLAARARALVGRSLGYYGALVVGLLRCSPVSVRLFIDGVAVEPRPLNNLIVANGQYFGGGMHPMPAARLDDGRLDVARIRELGRAALLYQSPLVHRGLPEQHPHIDHWRAVEVRAESDEWVLVEADGELMGTLPAVFHVRPASLRVVAPSPRNQAGS